MAQDKLGLLQRVQARLGLPQARSLDDNTEAVANFNAFYDAAVAAKLREFAPLFAERTIAFDKDRDQHDVPSAEFSYAYRTGGPGSVPPVPADPANPPITEATIYAELVRRLISGDNINLEKDAADETITISAVGGGGGGNGGGQGQVLTDSQIGTKAFENPPSDLSTSEKAAVRSAIGAGTGDSTLSKASNADVDAETDDTDYVTVLKVFRAIARKVRNATDSVRGVVLLARNADVDATESDTSRIPTVAAAKRLVNRLALPKDGSVTLPVRALPSGVSVFPLYLDGGQLAWSSTRVYGPRATVNHRDNLFVCIRSTSGRQRTLTEPLEGTDWQTYWRQVVVSVGRDDFDELTHDVHRLDAKTQDLYPAVTPSNYRDIAAASEGGVGQSARTSDYTLSQARTLGNWRGTSDLTGQNRVVYVAVRIPASAAPAAYRVAVITGDPAQGRSYDRGMDRYTSLGTASGWSYYSVAVPSWAGLLELEVAQNAASVGAAHYGGNVARDKVLTALGVPAYAAANRAQILKRKADESGFEYVDEPAGGSGGPDIGAQDIGKVQRVGLDRAAFWDQPLNVAISALGALAGQKGKAVVVNSGESGYAYLTLPPPGLSQVMVDGRIRSLVPSTRLLPAEPAQDGDDPTPYLFGYDADEDDLGYMRYADPNVLGTGTPGELTVLYGDGAWRAVVDATARAGNRSATEQVNALSHLTRDIRPVAPQSASWVLADGSGGRISARLIARTGADRNATPAATDFPASAGPQIVFDVAQGDTSFIVQLPSGANAGVLRATDHTGQAGGDVHIPSNRWERLDDVQDGYYQFSDELPISGLAGATVGVTGNGTRLYVIFYSGTTPSARVARAYNGTTRDAARDIALGSANSSPSDAWWDTTRNHLYVADTSGRVFVYGTAAGSSYGNLLDTWTASQTGYSDGQLRAVCGRATVLYLCGPGQASIRAFNLTTKARQNANDVALGAQSRQVFGMDTDGFRLYTSQEGRGEVHVYVRSGGRDARRDAPARILSGSGTHYPGGVYVDQTDSNTGTIWITNASLPFAVRSFEYNFNRTFTDLAHDYYRVWSVGQRPSGGELRIEQGHGDLPGTSLWDGGLGDSVQLLADEAAYDALSPANPNVLYVW